MSYKIQVLEDGEPIKFKRGGAEVEVIECDSFLFVTDSKEGAFSVDTSGLGTHEQLGRLELAGYITKQDFRARNYGTFVGTPKK